MGSWSNRRRAIIRSGARRHSRGSTFWNLFLSALATKPREKSWPDASTTSSGSDRDSRPSLAGSLYSSGDYETIDALVSVSGSVCPVADSSLQSDVLSEFMRCWVNAVSSSSCGFGLYVRAFQYNDLPILSARCRDILPLPVIAWSDVEPWTPIADGDVALSLLNLVCAGLNYLFCSGGHEPVPARPTSLHLAVARRIKTKLNNSLSEMGKCARRPIVPGSYNRLTSDGTAHDGKYPDLRVDDIDMVMPSAKVDPMPHMPHEVQDMFMSPKLLFSEGTAHIGANVTCKEKNKGDSITLTLRSLRAGKLSLARCVQASADTFVVAKRNGVRLREVWNGGKITDAAVPPIKPPMQVTPSALSLLEATDDRPLWLICRDGRVFFDQLQVPPAMRPYFGRPMVAVSDLIDPPPCESGATADIGLNNVELDGFLVDGPLQHDETHVTPIACSWPMGFGWSSYVAQSTMVATCLNAGFHEESFLSDERLMLPNGQHVLAVATDDVSLFENLSLAERASLNSPSLAKLDSVWSSMSVEGQTEKTLDGVSDAKVLGVEFCASTRLQSRGAKLFDLPEASIDFMTIRTSSPKQLQVLNGNVQWQNLMGRLFFLPQSCLFLRAVAARE